MLKNKFSFSAQTETALDRTTKLISFIALEDGSFVAPGYVITEDKKEFEIDMPLNERETKLLKSLVSSVTRRIRMTRWTDAVEDEALERSISKLERPPRSLHPVAQDTDD